MKGFIIIFIVYTLMTASNACGAERELEIDVDSYAPGVALALIELTNWRLDEIALYETPRGAVIGKIILERQYPKSEKKYLIYFLSERVDYLIVLRGENVDFHPYMKVDGEASQHIKLQDNTRYGGTVSITGGYILRMRLISQSGEWAEVVIDEPTNRTAFIKTHPDFRLYKQRYEF